MDKDLHIKKLSINDIVHFEQLIKLFAYIFEMKEFCMPKRAYLHKLLSKDDFHVFAVIKESSVIGGLTAYTLSQYYCEKPLAYIFDLAVSPQWQRQGVGKALIQETKLYFQQNGYEALFVQAENADTHAVEFYRKTQPTTEDSVLHFTWEKQ